MKALLTIVSTILTVLLFQAVTLSQPCLPGGITFSTQEQVDSFQINYPYCTEIEGDVKIAGDNISNLNGLNVLTTVEGDIEIGVWFFNSNPNLLTLEGLNNITEIGGDLRIGVNFELLDLQGLNNVETVGGDLFLHENHALLNLMGLENLDSIGGSLRIQDHYFLNNLSGLENVTYIGEDLFVYGNDILTSLSSLNNLTSIGDDLKIMTNTVLTSLSELENVDYIGNNLQITHNSSLTMCAIESICDYLAAPNGTIYINVNAPGCNSIEEIEEACLTEIEKSENLTCNLSIYPNPARETISIKFLSNNKVTNPTLELMTLTGNLVKTFKLNNHESLISIRDLSAGIYLYNIKSGTTILMRGKIVKQ